MNSEVDPLASFDPADPDQVRLAIRSWLQATLPEDWPACGPGPWLPTWRQAFYAAGWAAGSWPLELGGLGLSPPAHQVVNEELARADAPVPYNLVTVQMVGATLLAHATSEQQARMVPDLARGRAAWCQLFSEPGAGSDLASLSCRADHRDHCWIINGQKVWSSFANAAARGLLLARPSGYRGPWAGDR